MPGTAMLEAMLQMAASRAGFRQRWWGEMAEAARHTRRAYWYGRDPRCEPWYGPHYDPRCYPPHAWCDPCEPRDSCEDRDPCEPCDEQDPVNIKDFKRHLGEFREYMDENKKFRDEKDKAKFEAAIDEAIHCIKLARITEAMRRKKWSQGKRPYGYPYY
jgi:hypothetical protein